MNKLSFSFFGTIAVAFSAILIPSNPAHSQGSTFACDSSTGVPATIVQSPQHGTVRIIEWKTTEFGSDFDPQTRCNIVSEKFRAYAQAGTLKYFTTGSVDRIPVICAVASENAPCNADSMLYTLKKGADADATLKQLLDVRSGASREALNETGSRLYIDFEQVVAAKAQKAVNAGRTIDDSEANSEAIPLF